MKNIKMTKKDFEKLIHEKYPNGNITIDKSADDLPPFKPFTLYYMRVDQEYDLHIATWGSGSGCFMEEHYKGIKKYEKILKKAAKNIQKQLKG